MQFVGVNDNGVIAGNADFVGSDVPLEGTWGSVYNRTSGTMTLFNGTVTGLSSSNYVSFYTPSANVYNPQTQTNSFTNQTINLLTPNLTEVNVGDFGYGGFTGGVNATGEMTGGLYTSAAGQAYTGTQYSVAFKTGSNGAGTQYFGTANGVYSAGTVINSSGQVGGYITLASGQTEAFLSTARGGAHGWTWRRRLYR